MCQSSSEMEYFSLLKELEELVTGATRIIVNGVYHLDVIETGKLLIRIQDVKQYVD